MPFPQRVVEHDFTPLGGAREMMLSRYPEVLLEGPAGTGKSRAVGEKILAFAETFPKSRICVLRKTRVSLTESWLVTWEQNVLYPEHELLKKQISRAGRKSYEWSNGSVLVPAGMDNPTRLFSTEFDIIFVNEATELSEPEFESLHRALRNKAGTFRQLIADCNPDAEFHWLNKRGDARVCNKCKETGADLVCGECGGDTRPQMHRIHSRHVDNPSLTDDYLDRLQTNLTGVRKQRLWFGRWVSAEGQIWEEWDPEKHLIDFKAFDDVRNEVLHDGHPRNEKGEIACDWYFASVDWGFRNPGVFQVWGVYDGCLYRVAEVYRTSKQIEWWAQTAAELHHEFDLKKIVCDPARDDLIEAMNHRLGFRGGRDADLLCIGADNSREAGWDQVRWAMNPRAHINPQDTTAKTVLSPDKPLLYLCRDSLRKGADEGLREKSQPLCTEQEIPSYVFIKREDGKRVKEESDPGCADHGCDALRYACMWAWGKDLKNPKPDLTYRPGSYGDVMNHRDRWKKSNREPEEKW